MQRKSKFTLMRPGTTNSNISSSKMISKSLILNGISSSSLQQQNNNNNYMSPNRLRRLGSMFLNEEEKQKKIDRKLNRMMAGVTIPTYMKKEIINTIPSPRKTSRQSSRLYNNNNNRNNNNNNNNLTTAMMNPSIARLIKSYEKQRHNNNQFMDNIRNIEETILLQKL